MMEKKLRGKLEEEVKELRQGKELIHSLNDNEDFENLRLKLSDYEEKVSQPFLYFQLHYISILCRLYAWSRIDLSGSSATSRRPP